MTNLDENSMQSNDLWGNTMPSALGATSSPAKEKPAAAEKPAKVEKSKPAGKESVAKRKPRPLATADNPVIQAILGERFRFPTKEQAIARLSSVRSQFPTIEDVKAFQEEGHDTNAIHMDLNITETVTIWIRNYNVSLEEEKQDFIGNYAQITIKKLEDLTGYYTLTVQKLEMPIEDHPQKRMRKQAHPNWGHYIIRGTNGKKIYQSQEEARNDLAKLHFEFPDTSIPATEDKVHLIVYDRAAKPPVQKLVLVVKPYKDDEGIECPHGRHIIKSITKNDRPFGQTKKNEALEEEQSMTAALNDGAARS